MYDTFFYIIQKGLLAFPQECLNMCFYNHDTKDSLTGSKIRG